MAIYYLALVISSTCTYGYVNVALNKQTWQAHPYIVGDSRFESSNAVDGLKSDLRALGEQCVISAHSKRTATWWVNLDSVYSIHGIRIYYRTDNVVWDKNHGCTRRFLGFYVYVSNTTNRLDGHLCFHDTNYTRSTIPAIAEIMCPVHGQYVIYYNERLESVTYPDYYSPYAYNNICEVEVYGCILGFYGSNCSHSCPDNCGDGYCHIETGVCSWCKPGYQGYHCQNDQLKDKEKCHPSFYATLGAFLVSALANVVLIAFIFKLMKWKREKRMAELTIKEKFNNLKRKPNDIYDNSDRNVAGDYQELGELGKPSHYDVLQ